MNSCRGDKTQPLRGRELPGAAGAERWDGASACVCTSEGSRQLGGLSSVGCSAGDFVTGPQALSASPEGKSKTLRGFRPWKILFSIGLVAYYPAGVGRKLLQSVCPVILSGRLSTERQRSTAVKRTRLRTKLPLLSSWLFYLLAVVN